MGTSDVKLQFQGIFTQNAPNNSGDLLFAQIGFEGMETEKHLFFEVEWQDEMREAELYRLSQSIF